MAKTGRLIEISERIMVPLLTGLAD